MAVVLAPAEVLAGLIAICVLFAAYLIAQIVSAIFSAVPIPVIGGAIGNAMSWFASHVLSAMGWLWAKTNPVAVWIALVNVWHATEQGLNAVVFGDINGALQWLFHSAIPAAAQWAVAAVHSVLDPFMAGVNAFIGGVLGFITWAHAQLAALWQAVTVSLPGLVHAEVAVVEGDLGRLGNQLEADIAAAVSTGAHALAAAVAGVEGEVQGWIGTAVRGVEGDLGKVRDLITSGVLPELATLGVAVAAAEATIVKVEECTAGICSSGSGNVLGELGKLLQGIEAVVTDVAIFELMTSAVRDSRGLARASIEIFAPVVNDTEALIRSHVQIPAA